VPRLAAKGSILLRADECSADPGTAPQPPMPPASVGTPAPRSTARHRLKPHRLGTCSRSPSAENRRPTTVARCPLSVYGPRPTAQGDHAVVRGVGGLCGAGDPPDRGSPPVACLSADRRVFITFMDQLMGAYRQGRLPIILDNAITHRSKEVRGKILAYIARFNHVDRRSGGPRTRTRSCVH